VKLYQAGATLLKPPNNLGLVGYWPMDEGTSTQAGDFSGNGNTGTLTTTGSTPPQWTSGKKGAALSFDGSTSYVSGSGVNLANRPFTISAWIYDTDVSINRQFFSLGSSCGVDACLHLRVSAGFNGTHFHFGQYGDDMDATLSSVTNRWTNLVVTLDGSKVQRVYQDGGLVNSNQAAGFFSGNTNWNIGAWVANQTEPFSGKIDDVRVYNHALTPTEVRALYQLGTALVKPN
jgi:hypothetical protein